MKERPRLAQLLESIRRRKRFSKQALGEASGVSAGYIGQIESGFDPRTGKSVEPSPRILRLLGTALGDGDELESERVYRDLMAAAGYLPSVREEASPYTIDPEPTVEAIVRSIRRSPELAEDDKDLLIRLVERSRRQMPGG